MTSLQQAPGIARTLWPDGSEQSQIYQIGQLQAQAANISIDLSNTLDKSLTAVMTDIPTFVNFANEGRYCGNTRPLDPNAIKNNLDTALRTHLTSLSLRENGWYAIPLGYSTEQEWKDYVASENAAQAPSNNPHPTSTAPSLQKTVWWSPATTLQYQLLNTDVAATSVDMLSQMTDNGWANLQLLFDGAFNCISSGRAKATDLVDIDAASGSLDVSCISKLPIYMTCGAKCIKKAADGSCLFQEGPSCAHSCPFVGGHNFNGCGRPAFVDTTTH